MRTQQYSFESHHRKGEGNLADVLSRRSLPNTNSRCSVADQHVNFMKEKSVPKTMFIEQIADATKADEELQANSSSLKSDELEKSGLYYEVRHELSEAIIEIINTMRNKGCYAKIFTSTNNVSPSRRTSEHGKIKTITQNKSMVISNAQMYGELFETLAVMHAKAPAMETLHHLYNKLIGHRSDKVNFTWNFVGHIRPEKIYWE